ncbi:hypothetical protein ABH935_009767 [Catenulispora sp. GAS73]|uniref:hypothetical protein n=1 Tax=Catenulispora sp. GAS73 TaxID=3156269 RepID=UPI0035137ED6
MDGVEGGDGADGSDGEAPGQHATAWLGSVPDDWQPPEPPTSTLIPPQPAAFPQTWTHAFTNSTILNTDGTSSTHYPDGTQDVRAPDGSCWRLAPSGAVVHAWQEPPVPQWHPVEPTAAAQPGGGTVVYHPDGSKELWYGTTRVARFAPNGMPVE